MACPIRLFVYGSLKPHGEYHDGFCRDVLSSTPGLIRGRIVERPDGYPTLFVPPDSILAYGSTDYHADAMRCDTPPAPHISSESFLRQSPPWAHVFGYVLLFQSALPCLAALDELEEYHQNRPSLYDRVLVTVWCGGELLNCWAYASPRTCRFEAVFST